MFNLANKITLARILIVPFVVILLYFPGKMTNLIAFFLFFIASATDMLDGFVARREGIVTSFGKFLDPLADKLLICSVLVMLSYLGWVPAWITIVIICRELIVTGLRAMAADEGIVIAADRYGKLKTIMQMLACGPLIIHEPLFGIPVAWLGEILLYIALVLTVFSGGNYLYGFYRNWLQETASS
ncbi:CDP-diacylglycerol--glycerol-3-phosphate 3-phosphatidyltransferase [Desulfovibrio psychrotolerans]|uniref:CDP-diacylglycerol--glycerol-3-phosphate 3-phosphatidyltransferase n=1 Tax=Desulfovibrio psychrotolerans TaxID=415242 RepID=A0A7J0BQK6_9BACT|nr:CDP-diacylglycerol--glycerol-3-phosphate 3-phosphatidyltransferase [Desulfovibrio psychrotolerans]GFM35462.1 CDP-diacylglycerol--glycerol-3-phosphate 3-phosphatidyltransferase [Desulfovibrio psychrotolerans]